MSQITCNWCGKQFDESRTDKLDRTCNQCDVGRKWLRKCCLHSDKPLRYAKSRCALRNQADIDALAKIAKPETKIERPTAEQLALAAAVKPQAERPDESPANRILEALLKAIDSMKP